MSQKSRRLSREQAKALRKEKKKAWQELRNQQRSQGIIAPVRPTVSNSVSRYETEEEERQARNEAVSEQTKIFRAQLPNLLRSLRDIKDPRNPKKVKHKHTVFILYGILSFVFQMSSRREANQKMTRPMFVENLKFLFPDLETIPHHDTLTRLLENIEVEKIAETQTALLKKFIKNKKFNRYLVANSYPIAIDGTQKFARDTPWAEECLVRELGSGEGSKTQYYVYVLEANLAFANGMSIPLMSEILSYQPGENEIASKQDCELAAFKRLAGRLKKEFPCLPIMVLLDGLYPNGPVMELCVKNKWQFMIVLQDKSLPSVWQEYRGLLNLQTNNTFNNIWGGRRQRFEWVNDIEYYYDNDKKKITLHVVICQESWEEIDKKDPSIIITKTSRHAWISSEPLSKNNVHERCNIGARHRWAIESGILVEKRCGYHYEHCFSYNWNAMKGYHYLMRLGHLWNVLTLYAERLAKTVKELGQRGLIQFIRETIAAPWLNREFISQRLSCSLQIRLQ